MQTLPRGVSVLVVAAEHLPAKDPAPPALAIGPHPSPQPGGPQKLPGIDRVIVIASGEDGVGKSTVSSGLAVAPARQGRPA